MQLLTHSHHPPTSGRKSRRKIESKICELRLEQFNNWNKKIYSITTEDNNSNNNNCNEKERVVYNTQEKQVVHSTQGLTSYWAIPSALPSSSQPLLAVSSPQFTSLHPGHDVLWCGTSLWLFMSAVPAILSPSVLCTCSLTGNGTLKGRWLGVSTAQQQLKHQCAVNITVTNPKHSAVPVTKKKTLSQLKSVCPLL